MQELTELFIIISFVTVAVIGIYAVFSFKFPSLLYYNFKLRWVSSLTFFPQSISRSLLSGSRRDF